LQPAGTVIVDKLFIIIEVKVFGHTSVVVTLIGEDTIH
jgi:hypothetical protein